MGRSSQFSNIPVFRTIADLQNFKGDEPAQKIILTHDRSFLIKLYQEEKFSQAQYIKIVKDGDINGTKKSTFAHCNVFKEFIKPAELIYLEELSNLVNNNLALPADAHDKLRIIFEAAFKGKYYLHLKEEIDSRQSLNSFTDRLVTLNIYTPDQATKFKRTFNKLQIPHHDNVEIKVSPNSEGDLKVIIIDSLELLNEI